MNTASLVAAIAPGGAKEDPIAAIKNYKFGDSTTPLKGVEGQVTGSLGNPEARKAIAAALGQPLNTVKSHIFRARDAIADRVRPLLAPTRDRRW